MPEITRKKLVQGSFGVVPSRAEVPAKADATKMVEVDSATFVWSDGLHTYEIQVDMDLLDSIDKQIDEVRAVHSGAPEEPESAVQD
jgi:hypothetical protein